jgi:hypothetical protein
MKALPVRFAHYTKHVYTVFYVIVSDIASLKNADLQKYALISRNTIRRNDCSKNQNYSYIHKRRPQNILEQNLKFYRLNGTPPTGYEKN